MTSARIQQALWLAVSLACGCASGASPVTRFENAPIVWHVADRRPIPKPEEIGHGGHRADVEAFLRAPILHTLSVPEPSLARNVNALGEVPDSTWFTNRIGMHDVSAEAIGRGHGGPGPDRSSPWRVMSRKSSGSAPGFVIEDALGARYIIKFDPMGAPETETGAEAVVARLLWAAGYNVPENHVVYFGRDDLQVADDAVQKLPLGKKVPLLEEDLDAALEALPRAADGKSWRAMASKYLDGIPVGGFGRFGVRRDDPNDRVPHEHRRDVRAQRVFFGWLGHTDVKQSNTLDMWVPQTADSERGVVVHHILDFGKALGIWGRSHEHDGVTPHFSYTQAAVSLLRFGLWAQPGEALEAPEIRGVGRFEAEHFEPAHYAPATPYPPFFFTDRLDAYWAAKIIARFDRTHVEAAVAAGRYSDPRAAPYLVDVLLERRRKVLRYGFARVNPVDHFIVSRERDELVVCATDLALRHHVASAARSRHRMEAYDAEGRPLPWTASPLLGKAGRICAHGLTLPRHPSDYVRIVVRTWRAERALPNVILHVAREPERRTPRIIGIERH